MSLEIKRGKNDGEEGEMRLAVNEEGLRCSYAHYFLF